MVRWISILVRDSFMVLLLVTNFHTDLSFDKAEGRQGRSVRLPYSLIPHMDYASRAYHKAISVLAKQTTPSVKSTKASAVVTAGDIADDPMDLGKSQLLLFLALFLTFLFQVFQTLQSHPLLAMTTRF